MVVDANNNVYVADTNNDAIRKVTPAGVVSTVVTGVVRPTGVTLSGGSLFVVSTQGRVVYSLSARVPAAPAQDGGGGGGPAVAVSVAAGVAGCVVLAVSWYCVRRAVRRRRGS